MNLENLFETFEITEKRNEQTAVVGNEPIVFITSCYHRDKGKVYDFSDKEYGAITSLLESSKIPRGTYQFIPAIRIPNILEEDVTTEIYAESRELLYKDLEEADPKVIIPLGNIAMKTLLKKSGLFNKRGKEFRHEDIPVVPTFATNTLYEEPKVRGLFVQDVDNAYDKFILNKNKFEGSAYVLCKTLEEVDEKMDEVMKQPAVAIDIETTGLDYKLHTISTIAMSYQKGKAFTIPILHRESPFEGPDLSHIKNRLNELMGAKGIRKIFHHCQFDLKFLMNFGVCDIENVDDTKIMHSLLDENLPHGLMDLVKQYFPTELEKF
jgi:hypothetical protein